MQQSDQCGTSSVDSITTAVSTTRPPPPPPTVVGAHLAPPPSTPSTTASANLTPPPPLSSIAASANPSLVLLSPSMASDASAIETKPSVGEAKHVGGGNSRAAATRAESDVGRHSAVAAPLLAVATVETESDAKRSTVSTSSATVTTAAAQSCGKSRGAMASALAGAAAKAVPAKCASGRSQPGLFEARTVRERKVPLRTDDSGGDIGTDAAAVVGDLGNGDARDASDAAVGGDAVEEDDVAAAVTNKNGGDQDGEPEADGDGEEEDDDDDDDTTSSVSSGSISPTTAMSYLFNRRKPAEVSRTVAVVLDVDTAEMRRRGEAICTMLRRRSPHQHVMVTERSLGKYLARVVRTGQDPLADAMPLEADTVLGELPLGELEANIGTATELVLRHTQRVAPQTRKEDVYVTTFGAVSGRDRVAYRLCGHLPVLATVLAALVWIWTLALLGIAICNWVYDRPAVAGAGFDGGPVLAVSDFFRQDSRVGAFVQPMALRWRDHWVWRAGTHVGDFMNECLSLWLSVVLGVVALRNARHHSLTTLLCVAIHLARYAGLRAVLYHLAFVWTMDRRYAMQRWLTTLMSVRNSMRPSELARTLVRSIAAPLDITPSHWIRHRLQAAAVGHGARGCVALVARPADVSITQDRDLYVIHLAKDAAPTVSSGPHLVEASARLDVHVSTPRRAASRTQAQQETSSKRATSPTKPTTARAAVSQASLVPVAANAAPRRVYKSATATATAHAQKVAQLETTERGADAALAAFLDTAASGDNDDRDPSDTDGEDEQDAVVAEEEDSVSLSDADGEGTRAARSSGRETKDVALRPTFVSSVGVASRRFAHRLGEVLLSDTITSAFGKALEQARDKYRDGTDTPQTKRKRQETNTNAEAAAERDALLGVASHPRRRVATPCGCGACGGAPDTADLVLYAGASYDEFVRVASTHLQEPFCLEPIRSTAP